MYQRILIVMEGDSDRADEAAVLEGLALAKESGGEVIFFSVLPRYVLPVAELPLVGVPSSVEFETEIRAAVEKRFAHAQTLARQAGVPCRHEIDSGVDDAQCVVDATEKLACDVVVVQSTGRNALMRFLSGSVIPGLITSSMVPVLVVREPSRAGRDLLSPLKQAAAKGVERTRGVKAGQAVKAAGPSTRAVAKTSRARKVRDIKSEQ